MKKMARQLLIWISILLLGMLILYLLRKPILSGLGSLLIKEDIPAKVDAVFILSGGSYERAQEATDIFMMGYTSLLIPTGENESKVLKALNIHLSDAEQTRRALINAGIDSTFIRPLPMGDSTFEESEQIMGYALEQGFTRIMVVSSKFHTRRLTNVFKDKFEKAGILVLIKGAPPITYDVNRWWESEEGLIFVFNEYVKLGYYFIRY